MSFSRRGGVGVLVAREVALLALDRVDVKAET